MRGKKLFNELLQPGMAEPVRKGRNDTLQEDRNKCLVARYYYYGHFKGKSYEDSLLLLMREFFLSVARINKIVQENAEVVARLKQNNVSLYMLNMKWPHLTWRR